MTKSKTADPRAWEGRRLLEKFAKRYFSRQARTPAQPVEPSH